jgi:coenzyme Q-binding protein COQ10
MFVERYPEFLPLCEALVIQSREEQANETILTASMTVGYRAIRESFSSRVCLRSEQKEIDVIYLDGPFSHLANQWRFYPIGGGSEVHFYIDYAFASRVLGLVMGAVFDKAVKRYAEAFEARARLIYEATSTQLH